jgi:hypothetical protein
MIFEYDQIIENYYKQKNNLESVNLKSKLFKKFKKIRQDNKYSYVKKYTNDSFKDEYIKSICKERKNKILSYCIDNDINYKNIPTIIVYRKVFKNPEKIRYVILLIVTLKDYRSLGYGNAAIHDFFDFIYDKSRKVEVILHSLKKSEKFYLDLGFQKIDKNLFIERLEGLNNQDEDINKQEVIFLKYTIQA